MPNYGYHFARANGNAIRAIYRSFLPVIARRNLPKRNEIPVNIVSYCGEQTLPEQVASIRSFLQHVGHPKQFTVVSDGTLSQRSKRILKSLGPMISISESREWLPKDLPAEIYSYLSTHPTGKQLAVIMSLPLDRPTLYIDSDVLFFPGAGDLVLRLENPAGPALYLPDCQLSADERLFHNELEKARPVNIGVLLFFEKLDWVPAICRFLEIQAPPDFFTNQTITHLTMHANGALPFDHRKYVLQLDDQFIYPDRYAARGIALRHYVNPVRHKFWTALAQSTR